MNAVTDETQKLLDKWATESDGPVALHLKQKLIPVESVNGEPGVIFPPTYADIGYNIDTLSDGTRVASIDSVGSQANRLEPTFREAPGKGRNEWLVPQIEIVLRSEPCGECEECKGDGTKSKKKNACKNPRKVTRSIFDLAHRAADAVVQSSPALVDLVAKAFRALQDGDAGPLCSLAPTSLVFGVWDSRGGSGEKRPRLVRSIIRAWDVEPILAAAQFNSVWKALDEEQRAELEKAVKGKDKEGMLSAAGLKDAPATFRKTKIQQYRDGSPNPEARVLGGVLTRDRIEREVTVNLVALRGLRGKDETETGAIRKYLLGLSLVAATADIELFLREGCHLRYADDKDTWYQVPRRGAPTEVALDKGAIKDYASVCAEHFRAKWQQTWPNDDDRLEYTFDLSAAKKLLAKKTEEEETAGGS
jgi:CRISPR-associated protein Csb1